MTRARALVAGVVVTALVAVVTLVAVHERPAVRSERVLGRVADGAVVDFSLVLRSGDQPALDRFLARLGGPAGTTPTLDARAFGARFGISSAALRTVLARVRAAGFDVVETYPQRTAIRLRGTAGQIASYFGTPLVRIERASGDGTYREPASTMHVPDELSPYVSAVAGLDTGAVPQPHALFDIPPDGLTPDQAATAYAVSPLYDAGIRGQGQTIAVYSAASFDPQDIATFDQRYGITSPPVERVPVNGGTDDTTSALAGEVALDLEVIRGIAPGAQILNYEVPTSSITSFAQSIPDVVDQVVADGRAKVLSISYGLTDTNDHCGSSWLTPEDRLRGERSLEAAAAAGVTVFVSSGDSGAYATQHFDPNCVRQSVLWPGSSQWVTSVGGTRLSLAGDGSYLSEDGWEDVLWHWGSGGGNNPVDARPSWQNAPGVQNPYSDGNRQVPDVAADADPDTGPITVFQGQLQRSGGTSASAPFWAASMLLVKQYLASKGLTPPGFANPDLYRLASQAQPFAPYHDVVRGGNRLRDCTPGWDYATGLGSPNVWNLARDLEAMARAS